MSMNDDDNGKQNDRLNAVVTKAKIADTDRKRINAVSKIASSFANVTLLLIEPKTNDQKLAQIRGIGIGKAKKFVYMTTQRAVCNVLQPLSRRFRTHQSLFKHLRFRGRVYTDTMFRIKSMRGNKTAQTFVADFGEVQVFPMHSKKDAHQVLLRYIQETGVPTSMDADNAKELSTEKGRRNVMEKHGDIKKSYIEPGSLWQNAAELIANRL